MRSRWQPGVNWGGYFYRNLKKTLEKYHLDEDIMVKIVLDICRLLKAETIVDSHKNAEVKRVIANKLDDYLYDIVKMEKGIKLENKDIQRLLEYIMELASNNHELFQS